MSVEEEEKGEINLKCTKFEDKKIDFDLNTLQNAWLSKTGIATSQVFISQLKKKKVNVAISTLDKSFNAFTMITWVLSQVDCSKDNFLKHTVN